MQESLAFLAWLDGKTKKEVAGFEDWRKRLRLVAEAEHDKNWDKMIAEGTAIRDIYPDYVEAGSVYEFFPNKEAIVAALVERRLAGLVDEVREGVEIALEVGDRGGAELLIRRIVDAVSSDRELYRVLRPRLSQA